MSEALQGHWKKTLSADARFLSDADLVGQPEIIATISHTSMEEVRNGMDVAQKLVLHFIEPHIKPLVLNKTNSKIISKMAKTPLMEQWKGTMVQIYYDPTVRFGREIVGGCRIRPFAPKVEKCSNCGKAITAHGKYSATELVEMSKSKFGRVLCVECGKAAKTKAGGSE